ncbi:MAG: efflux RND transporter periplasmic adaptor subunit [Cypionkella sp.]
MNRRRSPIYGTITQCNVDPGQYIAPAIVLFTLPDLSRLVIETNVDEPHATQFAVSQSEILQLIGSNQTLPGKVSFVSPRVDPASGGLVVKITPDDTLKAPVGLTVTANIVVEADRDALTIPGTALVNGPAGFLFKSEAAVKTPIEAIDCPAACLIVTKGLSAGDVLIANASGISDGLAVKAQN